MPLHLGRDICGHLAIAEQREWLVTNGIGGYACGTVAGLLTRHYHGLLVAALKPPLDRTLLVTKLNEQVLYGGKTYALGTNRWVNGSVSPQGYRYIEQFALEGTIPTQFAEVVGHSGDDYSTLSEQTRQGMQRFWSDSLGYCYDMPDGPDGPDASLRPNQIFAVALPGLSAWYQDSPLSPQRVGPSIFSPQHQKAVVDRVSQELLTSYGLRSLSPNHPDYSGRYGGDPVQRDSHYHQGPVWSWLMGPFVQAHFQVYHDPVAARRFLEPMADHLLNGCVGSLSEIFDGDAPHDPRGTFAQAWTVAEVLRSRCLIENATNHP